MSDINVVYCACPFVRYCCILHQISRHSFHRYHHEFVLQLKEVLDLTEKLIDIIFGLRVIGSNSFGEKKL